MKNYINKHFLISRIIFSVLLLGLYSCSSSIDSYKKYTEGGERTYTGKVDSVTVYSGKNRVLVKGLYVGDPKITETRIFWDSKDDSAVVPVNRGNGVDTLHTVIDGLAPKVYNFQIFTYDSQGNASIPVYVTAHVYGDRYQASLSNRSIITNNLYTDDSTTTVTYADMDRSTGVFGSQIKYTGVDGQQHIKFVPIDSSMAKLHHYNIGDNYQYRTLYKPEETSIDTFYTDYQTVTPNTIYLDMGPFERSIWDGSRWGVLANWIENEDVKNAGNYTYGGYELRGGVGVISLEAGYGLPPVPNGKIYKVMTLPAGNYTFQVSELTKGSAGTDYIVAAEGEEVPDFADVTSQSLEYNEITSAEAGSGSPQQIQFELTSQTKVAIGFVGSMPDTGAYFKVVHVTLTRAGE